MIAIVMGVTGCGKTTIGRALARVLCCYFVEGDDFHSPSSIEKMRRGLPLSDEDRAPWLAAIRSAMEQLTSDAVVACSALKLSYRASLSSGLPVRFVHLTAPREIIAARLASRSGHFMPASLLDSQLDALELSPDLVTIDASAPPDQVLAAVLARIAIA